MASAASLADEIDRLSRRLLRNAECCDRRLAARFPLTPSQAHTLQTLAEVGETTMNGLAGEMRLHGTTMTRMVDALVEKGLVERVEAPGDRRVVRVRVSERGGVAAEELRRCKRDLLAPTLRDVPEAELGAMVDSLRRLVSLSERWGANCRDR